MSDPVRIVQVLLLVDGETSLEVGPALWAMLLEIERFYNMDQPRISFQRFYISPQVPKVNLLDAARRNLDRLLRGGKAVDDALMQLRPAQRVEKAVSSKDSTGRFRRTCDQRKLGQVVRDLIGIGPDAGLLFIVTDREITPPPEWRYIIWDDFEGGAVVSMVPTDPKYWRHQDPGRIATIKHRVRTATLSITGQFLGLERCENPGCFLYADVGSVTNLDLMTHLGDEHELPKLAGRGFQPAGADPAVVQSVVETRPMEGGVVS
jgi:hypothetical protein